jgi:hypothetical protein
MFFAPACHALLYAFPSYRYLKFVYGFSQTTISNTVAKLHEGLMTIDQTGGNNQYAPDMLKVSPCWPAWKQNVLSGRKRKLRSVLHGVEHLHIPSNVCSRRWSTRFTRWSSRFRRWSKGASCGGA